jgi:hypothetical protein
MTKKWQSILPDRENLRQAVRWISEQPKRDAQTIEDASRRNRRLHVERLVRALALILSVGQYDAVAI